MNITYDLGMGEKWMDVTGLKKGITCKLHNETDHGCPQECIGDCDKVGRENISKEFPDGGTHKGTYDTVILEKGGSFWAIGIYADITRGDVKTPLRINRLIISYIIYFIKLYIH